jgi:hypothetical protein
MRYADFPITVYEFHGCDESVAEAVFAGKTELRPSNNCYDWLDGYTQKYGGGFIWRRTLQNFKDIFRFKDDNNTLSLPPVRTDSIKTKRNETK